MGSSKMSNSSWMKQEGVNGNQWNQGQIQKSPTHPVGLEAVFAAKCWISVSNNPVWWDMLQLLRMEWLSLVLGISRAARSCSWCPRAKLLNL